MAFGYDPGMAACPARPVGIEPTTYNFGSCRSATELRALDITSLAHLGYAVNTMVGIKHILLVELRQGKILPDPEPQVR